MSILELHTKRGKETANADPLGPQHNTRIEQSRPPRIGKSAEKGIVFMAGLVSLFLAYEGTRDILSENSKSNDWQGLRKPADISAIYYGTLGTLAAGTYLILDKVNKNKK